MVLSVGGAPKFSTASEKRILWEKERRVLYEEGIFMVLCTARKWKDDSWVESEIFMRNLNLEPDRKPTRRFQL